MTPDQVKLVQQSFAKVAPISETAAVLFYDRLFEIAPTVRAMFPADMTEQRKKLMAMLAAGRERARQSRTRSCPPQARSPSAMSAYGAKAEHYPVVGVRAAVDLGKGAWRRLDRRRRRRMDGGLRDARPAT